MSSKQPDQSGRHGRLATAAPAGGGPSAQLIFDPLDRLSQAISAAGAVTQFRYDGADVVTEHGGSGNQTRSYINGPAEDERFVISDGGNLLWPLADERGSIAAVSDVNGNPVAINTYDEYGIPAAGNYGRFQFTGQMWLPEVGLYHNKARQYSPHGPESGAPVWTSGTGSRNMLVAAPVVPLFTREDGGAGTTLVGEGKRHGQYGLGRQMIPRRVVWLGWNCELAFQMKRTGLDYSGFFNWCISTPEVVCDLIGGRFGSILQPDNLHFNPSTNLVTDAAYGYDFHSPFATQRPQDDPDFGAKLVELQSKFEHFVSRFLNPDRPVDYLMVVRHDVAPETVERLRLLLEPIGPDYRLLVIRSQDRNDGRKDCGPVSYSYLAHLADPSAADEGHLPSWNRIFMSIGLRIHDINCCVPPGRPSP